MDHFGISLFLEVLTSEGYFGNYEKSVYFLEKAISEKIVAYFHNFKTNSRSPKTNFVCPSNILNNLLSKNPTLTRRCEVNKFNLVTYFSLYKYQSCGSLITQFSRPRVATIFSKIAFSRKCTNFS